MYMHVPGTKRWWYVVAEIPNFITHLSACMDHHPSSTSKFVTVSYHFADSLCNFYMHHKVQPSSQWPGLIPLQHLLLLVVTSSTGHCCWWSNRLDYSTRVEYGTWIWLRKWSWVKNKVSMLYPHHIYKSYRKVIPNLGRRLCKNGARKFAR